MPLKSLIALYNIYIPSNWWKRANENIQLWVSDGSFRGKAQSLNVKMWFDNGLHKFTRALWSYFCHLSSHFKMSGTEICWSFYHSDRNVFIIHWEPSSRIQYAFTLIVFVVFAIGISTWMYLHSRCIFPIPLHSDYKFEILVCTHYNRKSTFVSGSINRCKGLSYKCYT